MNRSAHCTYTGERNMSTEMMLPAKQAAELIANMKDEKTITESKTCGRFR